MYSQFIHGKTTGGRNYELVALTADLRGRETELEAIAQKYRFWGAQPPVSKPIAVGVFHYGDELLLVQAMQAARRNGQPATDVQGRPFTQHRYVFIPPRSLAALSGRLWLLFNWIMEETRGIPTFQQLDLDLPPLPAPQFTANWYNSGDELKKLERSLLLRDKQGRLTLLSTLSALIHRKRVLFDAAAVNDVFSEDLLEGVLLLLPTVFRAQVSVAAGALDAKICAQADLLVKTNGAPNGSLPADLLWNKRANNQFYGNADEDTLASPYTRFLEPILNRPNSRRELLRLLDSLVALDDPVAGDPWRALNNGAVTSRLIPVLPDPAARAKYWRGALKNLSPADWRAIIPTIVDETGLEMAWTQLQKLAAKKPDSYAPLVFRLWGNFSQVYIRYVLQEELPADLSLAETLITRGLLSELGPTYRADLFDLCLATLSARAVESPQRAAELLRVVTAAELFDTPVESLTLREALLPSRPDRAALLNFFKTEIIPILPTLSPDDLSQRRCYQSLAQQLPKTADLLRAIISKRGKALDALPELASRMDLSLAERQTLYAVCLNVWQPDFNAARPLLTDLLTQWIAASSPEDRPHLTTATAALGDWLTAKAPDALRPLLVAETINSGLENAAYSFADWTLIAGEIYPDALSRASFLDHVTAGQPVTEMLRYWLPVIADAQNVSAQPSALELFENSYTWHTLQSDDPAWLAEAIAQLLGWQPIALSALVPLLERLENALDAPQAILLKFLESLPRQGDDDMGLMLAAYLPQMALGKSLDLEALPVWQALNSQAPKVASVYKTLAEGQRNPAVDLFNQLKLNAALKQAPEYAPAMAHWLQLCGKGNWISGRLLETLSDQWQANVAAVDSALLGSLLRPDLSAKYTFSDWLNLAQLCWLPDYQSLWPLSGQPDPNARQQMQILSVAKERASGYATPLQAEELLVACRNWGLSHAHLAELTAHLPPETCNFRLLHPYLYVNGAVIEPDSHSNQNLLARAMQTAPADAAETSHLNAFLTRLLAQQLQAGDGVSCITLWQGLTRDVTRYHQALTAAALELSPHHFSMLVQRARQLQLQGAKTLSKTIISALDNYWQGEKGRMKAEG